MKLTNFSGGLNTRPDAGLIQVTEARVFDNIDTDTEVLTPIKDKVLSQAIIGPYSYYNTIDDEWLSAYVPTDWLEYQSVLYKCDRVSNPTKRINSIDYPLGIAAPTGAITLQATSAPEPIERVVFTATTADPSIPPADALKPETYKYKILNKDLTTMVSRSYFESPIEEVTIPPGSISKQVFTGIIRSSVSYNAYLTALIAEATSTAISIEFEDTNAVLVRVFRYFDGRWRALTADFQLSTTTVVDEVYDISANDELVEVDLLAGTMQYAITYEDSTTGVESAPLVTDEVYVKYGRILLTGIPASSNPQVDTVNIYRIGGNVTEFTLVTSISPGVTSYLDVIPDTELEGTLLTSQEYDPAPIGLKYLTEAYAMLFGVLGDQLRFTPIGKPDAWPADYYLDFPEDLTGISKTPIGLLIHTRYKTYLVTGTGPTAFAQQLLSGDQGCISHDTIKETKDTALWLSTDGICASDGSDVKVLSRTKLGKLSKQPVNAILHDQIYQVVYTDRTVLALDFERGTFKNFSYDASYLVVADDVLYGYRAGQLFELRASETTLEFNWRSPDFTTTGLTDHKLYSDVSFYSTGEITLKVYINDVLACTHTKTEEGSHLVRVPHSSRRGNFISFAINGTGECRELSWVEASAHA